MAGPQHGGSWPPIAAIAYGVHACGLLVRRGICHVPGGAAKGCLSEEAGSCSAAAWENALWYIRRCEGIWRIGCAGIEDERYGAWQPGYGIDERAPRCARGRRRPFSMGSPLDCNQRQLRTALQSSISVRRCAPGELAQHLPRGGSPRVPATARTACWECASRPMDRVGVGGRSQMARWYSTNDYAVRGTPPDRECLDCRPQQRAGMSRTAGCNPPRSIQRAFRALISRPLASSCSGPRPTRTLLPPARPLTGPAGCGRVSMGQTTLPGQ